MRRLTAIAVALVAGALCAGLTLWFVLTPGAPESSSTTPADETAGVEIPPGATMDTDSSATPESEIAARFSTESPAGPGPVSAPPVRQLDPPASEDPGAWADDYARRQRLMRLGAADADGLPIYETSLAVYAGDDSDVLQALAMLPNSSARARREAAELLANASAGENVEPILLHLLQTDTDEQVRTEAASGLETAESPEAVNALIAALDDPSVAVRENARASLTLLDEDSIREPLLAARENAYGETREMIDQILELTLGMEIDDGFDDWANQQF